MYFFLLNKTDATVVFLDSQSFRRLCGPLEEILKRNVSRYEKFVKKWHY
jgi:cAMP-dependent protein kinase regulator